uniref:Uncharacterized protein n=1 Tax=viral metagenome TaxID=1070528 RepID=A0A6C0HDW1_9ZZZZ
MLLFIILLMIVSFYTNVRENFRCGCSSYVERFGWSCTFTPSEYPKVDMGTVRDKMANDEYMAWVNGVKFYDPQRPY